MSIQYIAEKGIFHLQTPNTSYIIALKHGLPMHVYYGKKIDSIEGVWQAVYNVSGVYSYDPEVDDMWFSSDGALLEYSVAGSTDKRICAFCAEFEDGSIYTRPVYKSHRIYNGKPKLSGLPATYVESDDEATTLEITLCDDRRELVLILRYTVFEVLDVITRGTDIVNLSENDINIKSAMSMSMDISGRDYDFVHLYGAWGKERNIQKNLLINGNVSIESTYGASGHYHSPFVALANKNVTESQGEVMGFCLVYSGNFYAGAEVNYFDMTRVSMGINPRGFSWRLGVGEAFVTPEVVMTYSREGLGSMSRTYHKLFRTRLMRGKYRTEHRPVLINNWEATYMDFNEQKIVDIATAAKELGVELMVLDDGWFGKRDNDRSSLGDWYVNKDKLPNGIKGLAQKVNDVDMKFGLWFEPEMISPDSELYRAHPDWCIQVEGMPKSLGRHQLILDLSRKDVCDYVKEFLTDTLSSANIAYIKWDMNRNFGEIANAEQPHRYMLGLYDICEYITEKIPDVLFEGCASGGGRFDAGMLYYFPQYWCSDDTDACERLRIQYGTSMIMPTVAVGSHVSAVPNHQCGRITPLDTRAYVAMCGTFGYELDISQMSDGEKVQTKKHIALFKDIQEIIHAGDLYRLRSPFDGEDSAVIYVAENRQRAVAVYVKMLAHANTIPTRLKFAGLDETANYVDKITGERYSGGVLVNIGITLRINNDFESKIFVFERID